MNDVVVALLSFLGMVIGSVVSIVTSSRLTTYKIDELTKIVEKHNSLIERTYHLEQTTASARSIAGSKVLKRSYNTW